MIQRMKYIERTIDAFLLEWKNKSQRKPLPMLTLTHHSPVSDETAVGSTPELWLSVDSVVPLN